MPVLERSMIRLARNALLALVACLICLGPLAAQAPAVIDVAPASGARIEAVATGFALAVTYPRAGNIGGGGYMLIHLAGGKTDTAIDYRETAPAATTREIFLDERGEADPRKSQDSALAIGVPGTVAGLALAHAKYGSGKFTLAQLIAPAIALARWPATTKIFFAGDGRPLPPGATLLQRDLADTLTAIAREGPTAFYRGAIAEKLVAAVRAAGGIMTRDDLERYRPIERTPTVGSYRGYRILSMPPSSSGGVALVEMLNILEGYRLGEVDAATRVHLMVEAMKRAYFDRAKFLGDPASVTPPAYLTSKRFAQSLRERIDPDRASAAASLGSIFAPAREGDNTTHFSVVDRFGNAVANTTTLNLSYGLGLVAEGTGILLNNELDDFAAKPGAPNAYGLIGGDANAPGPRKRPLSSMTPTIVLKDGKPFLVTGTPGGSRIITTVLQVIVNVVDRKLSIADAIAEPRAHHQWWPDEVVVERGFSPDLIGALKARGHTVVEGLPPTSANSILVTPAGLLGAADNRTRGALAVGY